MNFFEKILYFFQKEMERPNPYGWFHLLWILLSILAVVFLYLRRKNYSEKQLKVVLGIYGITALILELIKQLIWSFNYENGVVTWDYQWYAAPFQLCTTPIYVSLICLFLKKGKLRNSLLAYVAYITIFGSIATAIMPDSCFVRTIEVNIHTMFLHFGSLVLSIYLMINEVKPTKKNFVGALKIFLGFVFIALLLDIVIYHSGILGEETFNMFFISPYFISTLPVYDKMQEILPYPIYLLFYLLTISIGGYVVYFIHKKIKK